MSSPDSPLPAEPARRGGGDPAPAGASGPGAGAMPAKEAPGAQEARDAAPAPTRYGGTGPLPQVGVGPGGDPGFVRSLRGGTLLGQLRTAMLVLTAAPLLILAIVPFIVREGRGRLGQDPTWVYVPLVAAALVALAVGLRVPRPLSVGRTPRQAARASVLSFRQALFLRFALCDAVIIMGLPLSIVSRSELPFLLGFVLGYPLLLLWTLPTTGLVERVRRRLEADGAESYLWAALLSLYTRPREQADRPPSGHVAGPGTGPAAGTSTGTSTGAGSAAEPAPS